MELKFKVFTKIQKPISDVFDAVYNPKKLEKYFTTKMASTPLDEGTIAYWDFADFPTEDGKGFPVKVVRCVKDQEIIFEWEANEAAECDYKPLSYNTTVEVKFESLGPENTMVSITEYGWKQTPSGLNSSYGNCMGWSQMLSAMKAYLEYGINLRKGAY